MAFDEDYFERGIETGVSLYSSYRWLPELTLPMAHEIIMALGLRKTDAIVDFGAAKGFLVKALRLLKHHAWGVDISDYARVAAPDDVKAFLHPSLSEFKGIDWVISKDVLEHVPYEKIDGVLREIAHAARRAFIIVPLGDGKRYNAPEYEKDKTHIIREDLMWWSNRFLRAGLHVERASTDMPLIKAARCRHSDGFFVLRRET